MQVLAHSFGVTVAVTPHHKPCALSWSQFIQWAANRGAHHTRWREPGALAFIAPRHVDPNP